MSDVYIAFVRDDQSYAESLAVALQGSGFGVSRSSSVVEAVQECPAILVLWSPAAARSKLFMDAAERAYRSGKMILARMGVDPLPAVFSGVESHTLTRWSGDPESPDIDGIVFQVDRLVSRARLGHQAEPEEHYEPAPRPQRRPPLGVVHAFPGGQQARQQPQTQHQPAPTFSPQPHQPEPVRPSVRAAATIHAPQTDPLPTPASPHAPQAPLDPLAAEAAYWRRIQRSANPDDFYAYLERYGSAGAFAEIAEARLRALTPQSGDPAFAPQPTQPAARPSQAAPMFGGHPPAPAHSQAGAPPRRHEPAFAPHGLQHAPSREPTAPEPRSSSRGVLEPHPARYQQPAAPPEPERRGGGGLRGMIFLGLIAAMLAGGFYIYSAFTGGPERTVDSAEEDWPPRERAEGEAGAAGAETGEPGGAQQGDPIFDQRFDDARTPGSSSKARSTAEPAAALQPRAATEEEPSGAELYRRRQTTTQADAAFGASDGAQETPAREASAAFSDGTTPMRPVWASKPSEEDMLAHYPQEALRARVAGRVVLDCVITVSLSTKCLLEAEQPTGYGFGAAGIRVSQSFQSGPYLADRRPAAGEKVQLTIDFRPPR